MGKHKARWARTPQGVFVKKQKKDEQSEANKKVMSGLVQQLERAKKEVPREAAKVIQRAKDILKASEKSTVDLSTDTSDEENYDVVEDTSTNSYHFLYPKKTWTQIIINRDKKKWSWNHLVKRYKLLKTPETAKVYLSRMRKELKKETNHLTHEDLDFLDRTVWEKVSEMDNTYEVIHDFMIKDIALKQAKKIKKKFRASATWIQMFKKRHNLVSRHIDCYVTEKKIEESEKMEKTIDDYRRTNFRFIKNKFLDTNVWNTDQTGLKLELTGTRTITQKGKKKIYRKCQRMSAMSHSITLHLALNANGHLFKKTYLILHEKKLPKKFEAIRHSFKYLEIRNTQSGLMNSKLAVDWLKTTFLPKVPKNSVLVLDAWRGFECMKKLPIVSKKKLHIQTLPAGTTAKLQPLDVFYNRQVKSFIRKMNDQIRYHHKNYAISKREHLLTICNLMLSQFSASRFIPMGRLAWHQSGYNIPHPPHFETPDKYCFTIPDEKQVCHHKSCKKGSFLRCAHCENAFCFKHTLSHIH